MWTAENRGRYDRSKLRYPSDLTNEEWQLIEPLMSYAGFWVTRRSGGVVCRHLDDLDAVGESDTCDDLRQLICSFQPPPGV